MYLILLQFSIVFCYYSMTFNGKLCLLLILPLFLAFFSCSARIDGEFREGGAVDVTLKTSLEPRMIALILSLRGFMGESANDPILDSQSMSKSMGEQPGVRAVSLKNTSSSAMEGTISISKVDDFLAAAGSKTRLITYTEGREAGSSSIVIALDKESAPEIISRLSPEAEEYLGALMAPVILGESSTKQEYLFLLSMVYGRPLADEISGSRLKVGIEFPRAVKAVRGGIASGRRAEFDVPIIDILVLEQPLRYEVNW